MKKIPSVFMKRFDENGKFVETVSCFTNPECRNAFLHGIATIKIDGTAACVINGKFYVRYDAKLDKNGNPKPIPDGAIPCQERDPITGHMPCWIPAEGNPSYKWHNKAFKNYIAKNGIPENGTYEVIGVHFQKNPEHLDNDTIEKHGSRIVDLPETSRTFEGVRKWLNEHYVEGLVFWMDGEPVCKIKRTDFHLEWNGSFKHG